MSRIGYATIQLPENVTAQVAAGLVEIKGEKGDLTVVVPPDIKVEVTDGIIKVTRDNELKLTKSLHGTVRALLANAVTGVKEGWAKKLEIHGSGYRASVQNDAVDLQVGYSHPVALPIPTGLEVAVVKNVITVKGIDKQLVGAFSAKIRAIRKPEPYKGKGIKYQDEHIVRKVGKALKASA